MINVVVVDDDKLVRKGLISAMPWSEFGMEVVGEAGNGAKALELLETLDVDLLVTDLAMPVMSGIELIRSASERYPDLFYVVLSMHQDFEYVQESLRLGAIDYIAKYQLEKERFEEVLGRVHGRILQERAKAERLRGSGPADICAADAGYVFLSTAHKPETDWLAESFASYGAEPVEIELNAWMVVTEAAGDGSADRPGDADMRSLIDGRPGWSVMKLTGIGGRKLADIHHAVRSYTRQEFFYDCDADGALFERSLDRLCAARPAAAAERPAAMQEEWLSFRWLLQDDLFDRLLRQLKDSRLPPQELVRLLTLLEEEWRRVYSFVDGDGFRLPPRLACWSEVERWLRRLRESADEALGRSAYSEEVAASVLAAVKIVQTELDQHLYAVDVARRVGVSRSYFSQCFKEITGQSFNDYLRGARVEKAMEYLTQTAYPIQWIAEKTGYQDDKYFSRVFRDKTGMLPSEYRARHARRLAGGSGGES